jgi:CPA2 family monovalent cation:H+ antiporter-2
MVMMGFGGKWMGWKQMDCIFLGVILSISSTTIILKPLMNWVKAKNLLELLLGPLSFKDIVAILMMVLLIYSCSKSAIFRNGTVILF